MTVQDMRLQMCVGSQPILFKIFDLHVLNMLVQSTAFVPLVVVSLLFVETFVQFSSVSHLRDNVGSNRGTMNDAPFVI